MFDFGSLQFKGWPKLEYLGGMKLLAEFDALLQVSRQCIIELITNEVGDVAQDMLHDDFLPIAFDILGYMFLYFPNLSKY